MSRYEQAFGTKVRIGVFLFRYGYLDFETITDNLTRWAAQNGVTRELGEDAVTQILFPLEPQL
jgi:hypothetical protein